VSGFGSSNSAASFVKFQNCLFTPPLGDIKGLSLLSSEVSPSLFSELEVSPSSERGRRRFISSSEETSRSDEKLSIDEESLSSFVLCFFVDVVDSSTSSSSQSRLLSLEIIVFSVIKSVVLGLPSTIYMESPITIPKGHVQLFSEES
jgi:hypothetical protein